MGGSCVQVIFGLRVRFALPARRALATREVGTSLSPARPLPPMDYAEEQENELMMLESMYMEDFVKLVRRRAA